MADPGAVGQMQMDWKSGNFRQRVIQQIDDALRMSATPMNKSSTTMENHVFQKAKTRDEYMALVARLILHVKGFNQKDKDAAAAQMGQPGMGYQQGQPQGMPQGGPMRGPNMGGGAQGGLADPMHALQNLAMQGTANVQGQMQQTQGMMGARGIPQQGPSQRIHGMAPNDLIQQSLVKQQQQQQVRPQLQRQDAFMVTSAQSVQLQPVVSQQLASSSTITPQQQMTHQYQGPRQPNTMTTMTSMPQQMFQQQVQQQQQLLQQQQQQLQQQQQHQQQQQTMNMAPHTPQGMSAVPSPMQNSAQRSSSPMTLSMMTSPSPQAGIVPSPAGRPTPGMFGDPSPGSMQLNTPVGAGQGAQTTADDILYQQKISQLAKYVEPLRRMIHRDLMRQGKDPNVDSQIQKRKNLLEILTNPQKKLPIATLIKCEQVLVKLDLDVDKPAEKTTPIPDVTAPKPVTTASHMCLPLLDAVMSQLKSPLMNHSLQRTFGPVMSTLHGSPIKAPTPPPKRQKREEEDAEDEVPHILQCEIASLGSRFKVNFDPNQHRHSKDIHLICKLDDKNLPSIPPIAVKIPETYPAVSPECDTKSTDYESNHFLQTVQQSLGILLLRMPDKFTFTELLEKWEISVRKACVQSL